MTAKLMFAAEILQKDRHLGTHSLYHILWTVDHYWEEIEKFFQQLEKKS